MKKTMLVTVMVLISLGVVGLSQAALVVDDFESGVNNWQGLYHDMNVETTKVYEGSQALRAGSWYDPNLGWWASDIKSFATAQDWSTYDTLQVAFAAQTGISGRIYIAYENNPGQAIAYFEFPDDGTYHVYDVNLGSSPRNNLTGFRFTWIDTDISGAGDRYFYYDSIALVPEPATIGLLGIALIGLIKKRT